MIGEIALIISGIKAVNDTLATLKESKDNIDGFASLFGKVSETEVAIQKIDQQVEQGEHTLTTEESLQLAYCREEVRKQHRELKRKTPAAVWRDALMLKSKSEREAKEKVQRQQKAIAKKKRQVSSIIETVMFFVGLSVTGYLALLWAGIV